MNTDRCLPSRVIASKFCWSYDSERPERASVLSRRSVSLGTLYHSNHRRLGSRHLYPEVAAERRIPVDAGAHRGSLYCPGPGRDRDVPRRTPPARWSSLALRDFAGDRAAYRRHLHLGTGSASRAARLRHRRPVYGGADDPRLYHGRVKKEKGPFRAPFVTAL